MQRIEPVVSVIVPIYNVQHYLKPCIDSICEQTYTRLEIILVDDGSTDDCGRICDDYAEIDSRITVLHKENGGLSSARNAGLDMAKGEYISFVDADDTVHPSFIEILIGLCRDYQCTIAQCDYLTVAENSLRLPLNTLQSIKLYNNKQALYELCCTSNGTKYTVAWNKLYKKELFQNIRYPLGRIHEDEFTTYLLLWKSEKTAVINQYLYYYLQRSDSIMGSGFSVKRLDGLEAFRERLEFLKDKQLWEEYEGTLRAMIHLIESSCSRLWEKGKASESICAELWKEKEAAERELRELHLKKGPKGNAFPRDARIILYGAGYWGRVCYQRMKESQYGVIVGWVDNAWNELEKTEYPVGPVDAFMRISFDYVLLAIKDRLVQEEVAANLVGWGIPREKIVTPLFLS